MNFNADSFLFIPLGGVGKIGMNVTLYHFQEKWIMVDLGAGFADTEIMPGINMIVADISFIKKHRKNLLGIILTHAHEDHLGAVQYLWEDLRCPVYTTRFTAIFLKSKLKEFSLEVPIKEVNTSQELVLKPFTIEFINMTHSIPEMHSLAIHTNVGSILHTGDWKLDNSPVIGPTSNVEKLKQLGKNGLLAVVCDSTNIFTKGKSGSEGDLYNSLFNIIQNSTQRVAVSLFASNVARIYTFIKISQQLDRHVVILGKSLIRIVQVAKDSGYLNDVPDFITQEQARQLPKNKVLYICTGCQGEPLAATAKLSNNAHRMVTLESGDTIIFSSKIIPGNDKRIFNVFNRFVNMNVKVITEFMDHVHVSGHPSRDDIITMYSLTNPKLCIPVHGEYIHMYEHAKVAQECGIKNHVIPNPGDVIDIVLGKKIDSVQSGYFGVDGHFFHHPEGKVMSMRRKMKNAGIIIIILIMNKKNQLLKDPSIIAPGVLDEIKDKALIKKVIKTINSKFYANKVQNIKSYIKNIVFNALKYDIQNVPVIEVQIEYLL
ncbi:ribonuclease J [Neoehrlichia mikurensis]|uniref:Ribonuclease J n=1 Tax=Neoehrlichia mikurensis TaxID=89586 RepID=A0A9Q9BQU0_9RICK|nr:ribonuclease J [Neoehrlichia mikurensis]QXK92175.1 ribonuclease J [Neoehrlichia mikurensis]QXK92630.1 ribonuclease J [Neoehrlichia mikurensis]QXK93869.1 ribonuclease J [Neoehrlichia mikurensis]UTO55135.1 ribonuclease J [Neoehrlichia mikurensis]UTO56055.1 ribonuclease J [Neoehrlichia mikurensis]